MELDSEDEVAVLSKERGLMIWLVYFVIEKFYWMRGEMGRRGRDSGGCSGRGGVMGCGACVGGNCVECILSSV